MDERDNQDGSPDAGRAAIEPHLATAVELVADLRRELPVGSPFNQVFVGQADRLIDALIPVLVEGRDRGIIDLDREGLLDAVSGAKVVEWAVEPRISVAARNRLLEHLCLDLGWRSNFAASGRRYSAFLEQLAYARMYVVAAIDGASAEAAVA